MSQQTGSIVDRLCLHAQPIVFLYSLKKKIITNHRKFFQSCFVADRASDEPEGGSQRRRGRKLSKSFVSVWLCDRESDANHVLRTQARNRRQKLVETPVPIPAAAARAAMSGEEAARRRQRTEIGEG